MSTSPVEMAYILDYVKDESELNTVLALQKIMNSAGSILGPFMAGWFTPSEFPILVYALVGVNAICLLVGSLFWVDASQVQEAIDLDSPLMQEEPVIKGNAIPDEEEAVAEEDTVAEVEGRRTFLNCTVVTLLFISVINSLAFQFCDVNTAIYFKVFFSFTQKDMSEYLMTIQLATLLWTPIIPTVLKLGGEKTVCIVTSLALGAVVMNLVILQGVWWVPYFHATFMVGFLGTVLGFGYLNILQKQLHREYIGTFFGLSNSLMNMGGTVAPLIGGFIYDTNHHAPFLVSAAIYLLTAVIYALLPSAPIDTDDDEEEEEVAPPPRTMTRPMSLQVMTYGTTPNPAVNLLSVDIGVSAEVYAAARANMRRAGRPHMGRHGSSGAMGMRNVATAPGLDIYAQSQMPKLGSTGRIGSRAFSFGLGTQPALGNSPAHSSDGDFFGRKKLGHRYSFSK
jgi:hypothetical protein